MFKFKNFFEKKTYDEVLHKIALYSLLLKKEVLKTSSLILVILMMIFFCSQAIVFLVHGYQKNNFEHRKTTSIKINESFSDKMAEIENRMSKINHYSGAGSQIINEILKPLRQELIAARILINGNINVAKYGKKYSDFDEMKEYSFTKIENEIDFFEKIIEIDTQVSKYYYLLKSNNDFRALYDKYIVFIADKNLQNIEFSASQMSSMYDKEQAQINIFSQNKKMYYEVLSLSPNYETRLFFVDLFNRNKYETKTYDILSFAKSFLNTRIDFYIDSSSAIEKNKKYYLKIYAFNKTYPVKMMFVSGKQVFFSEVSYYEIDETQYQKLSKIKKRQAIGVKATRTIFTQLSIRNKSGDFYQTIP